MTLMLDPEPTLAAPSEDETQSIHAWSQEDAATEVVEYRPRSWRTPLLIAAAAVAAICTAGVVYEINTAVDGGATNPLVAPEKPQVAAPAKPSIVPSPPIQMQSPDQRFLNLLQQRGVKVVSPPAALAGAHDVCRLESEGHNAREIAQAFANVTPGADFNTEGVFVMTAEEIYCPK